MHKKIINVLLATLGVALFSGCVASENRVTKVQEVRYPEGITVSMYDAKLQDGIALSDARLVHKNSKKQLQFILNNKSDDTYNVVINSEWTDSRGSVISTYPRPQKVSLSGHSAKRMIVSAPNFKAKNVLLNIECASNCVVEKK